MGLRGRGPGEVYWLTSWSALFFIFPLLAVGCWLSCVSTAYLLYLLVVVFFCWLSGVAVGCQVLNVDCRELLSKVVVGFWFLVILWHWLVVDCLCRLWICFLLSLPSSSSRQLGLGKLIK